MKETVACKEEDWFTRYTKTMSTQSHENALPDAINDSPARELVRTWELALKAVLNVK